MSISSTLNNALTGLNASARMAEVVSSNLSNALTDGYARRAVSLSSVQIGGVGGGVQVDGITRFVDPGLLAERRSADADLAGQERLADVLGRLELAIGTPDDPANLANRLAALEAAFIRASADPSSDLRLEGIASAFDDLVATVRANDATIQSLRQEADRTIAAEVDRLNVNLARIVTLNTDIRRLSSSGDDTSALQDVRQRVVDEVAEIVPLRVTLQEDGSLRLMTRSGLTLVDGRAASFDFMPTPTITGDMTLQSGALFGVTLDGQPIDASDGIGRLNGGSLGAAFMLRDVKLPEAQNTLDNFAADLIARFQDPANDPTLPPGSAGILQDQGVSLEIADLPGLAGRLTLNADILSREGGSPTLLRDGLGAGVLAPNTDATQINRWIDALGAARSDLPGTNPASASARASDLLAQIGSARLDAEDDAGFANARWSVLKEAELADGVDTDAELQTLLRVEQFYAANAKVIETADFLMRKLLEI